MKNRMAHCGRVITLKKDSRSRPATMHQETFMRSEKNVIIFNEILTPNLADLFNID